MMPPLLLFVPILFLGGVFSSIAGGGLGIVTIVLGSFFLPIQQNLAITALLMFAIQVAKIFFFCGEIRWDITLWYGLPGLPTSFIAGGLLFLLYPRLLEIVIGLLCLLFALHPYLPFLHVKRFAFRPSRPALVVIGAFNGVIAGIVGNGSLIRAPALLSMGLRKEEFIGTSTAVALMMNLGRNAAYAPHIVWSHELIVALILLFPLMMFSVGIGKKLLHYVSVPMFENLQHGIMFVGAMKLLFFP
ncbi:MAG: sulfite exporter TauE/SafE family protein [Patescibacteria group bacterium]